jgi:hypothetical protein
MLRSQASAWSASGVSGVSSIPTPAAIRSSRAQQVEADEGGRDLL